VWRSKEQISKHPHELRFVSGAESRRVKPLTDGAGAFSRESLFYRFPAGGSDLKAKDLSRLSACRDGLAFCRREPGADEAGDHIAIEPIDSHKQRFGSTMRAASK
jgi:hypothetical protein